LRKRKILDLALILVFCGVLLSGCLVQTMLPLLTQAIARETHSAAKEHKPDPLEFAIYAAVTALLGAGGAGYVGAKNGRKKPKRGG